MEKKQKTTKNFLNKIKTYFTTGILVLAPTAVTVWVLLFLFTAFDNILGKFYTRLFIQMNMQRTHIPGLGALTLAVIITLLGYFVRFYAGRKFFGLWESLMNRVPLINKIYVTTRQLSDVFSNSENMKLGKAVMVEYPRTGIYSVGWITNEKAIHFSEKLGKKVIGVYIATTPNPTSGMLIYVPEDELIYLDISPEDAMKLIISAGFIGPDDVTLKKKEFIPED